MRWNKIVGLTALIILLLAGSVGAITEIDSCTTINSPGEYVLNKSIINSIENYCINISSSNVTFDGSGFTIDGNGLGSYGVQVYSPFPLTNVTVKNLIVTDWMEGIDYNASIGRLINITSSSNRGVGIVLLSSNDNILSNIILNSNPWGMELLNSNNNTLFNITANLYSNIGIRFADSMKNTLSYSNANGNSYTFAGIELYSSGNNTLTNNTANKNGVGISLGQSSNNNTLFNNTVNGNGQGITLQLSVRNTLINNTVKINKAIAIRILPSSNDNTLSNNIVDSNFYGISIESSNNTINNNIVTNSYYDGIYIMGVSNNTLTHNIANYNDNGISVDHSINNTLDNNIAILNKKNGIYVFSGSNYNTITNNNASLNNYGIYLASSSNNTIFNNYLNNTINAFDDRWNSWNISKTIGINIMGGSWLGGNVWANPNGTGFSQTCADADKDGICDSSYILDEYNIDYLPLAYKPDNDTTPPASITNLKNISYASTYINWTWNDPKDADFSKVMIYLNGSFQTNVSKGIQFYNAGYLNPDTNYTISTHTVDTSGNINQTWVNHTARTASITDNTPPIAFASTNHTINNVGSKAFLNASASYDPDGYIAAYNWNFGDGTNASGSIVSHIYNNYNWNGTAYLPFNALLTITDNDGATNSTILSLKVYMAGDANGDGKVNILDAAKIGMAWNTKYGDANYDDGADLNNDDKVNILDMAIVGLNWNRKAQLDIEGTITLSGAWALYPMAVRWGEEFQKLHPKVKVEVSAGGSGKGMADAIGGLVDIGMVSRDIDGSEIEKGAFPIAVTKDGVVPTINAKNSVLSDILSKGVKRKTFVDIYINGTVKTWGEVVGKPEIKDGIHVYTRSDAAGASEVWAKYLGKKQENLKGTGVYGDPGLLAAVQKDPLGIGYNNYIYAFDMKTGQPVVGVQITPFDVNENGIVDPDEDISTKEKTIAAIKKGVFPHPPARVEYFVTKGKPAGLKAEFIKWTLTDGQKFVDEVGYIELPQEILDGELKKLD